MKEKEGDDLAEEILNQDSDKFNDKQLEIDGKQTKSQEQSQIR